MPTGTPIAYVAGDGHRPLPRAEDLLYRNAHAPQPKKPIGLDWDALTPSCRECGEKSRRLNNDDTCPTCVSPAPVPVPVAPKATPKPKQARPATPRAPRPTRQPRPPRPPRRPAPDATEIRRLYLEEQLTVPKVAAATGHGAATVRRVLVAAGVELRDDRRTHSGGRNQITEYPAEIVADVRRMYVDEGLTQAGVAHRLGMSAKYVQSVMTKHQIPTRPSAATPGGNRGRVNPIEGLKARIADLGVTSREIKDWAVREGLLMEIQVGVPPRRLVDAYAAAHPDAEAAS